MNIKELKMLRKILGLRGDDMAVEMEVSRQTIVNLESGKVKTKSTIKLYEMVILNIINRYDSVKKEELKTNLINIMKHL